MITMTEALAWLNQYGHTHLSKVTKYWIGQMANRHSTDQEIDEAITKALHEGKNALDTLHYAEVLLNCAETEFYRKNNAESEQYLSTAMELYQSDGHRRAVTAWMKGMINWETYAHAEAIDAWYLARKLFRNVRQENVNLHEPVKACWYADQLKKMDIELIGKAEHVMSWLTSFEPALFSKVKKEMLIKLRGMSAQNQNPTAYQLINDIKALCRNCPEKLVEPVLLTECAMAAHQRGNPQLAMELLQQAAAQLTPRGHHHSVIRWLTGTILWQMPSEKQKALRYWDEALECFDALALAADYQNRQEKKVWYLETHELMQEAIKEKVAGYL